MQTRHVVGYNPSMALAGGGSRKRKRERRAPTTVEGVKSAFAACSRKLGWRKTDIERASWLDSNGNIQIYRAKILPSTIRTVRDYRGKSCVVFVTKAEGNIPPPMREKPYELTYLCKGGCELTGKFTFASREQAVASVGGKTHRPR